MRPTSCTGPSAILLSTVDAGERGLDAALAGRALERSEVIGRPVARESFAVFDAIMLQDPRLIALRGP